MSYQRIPNDGENKEPRIEMQNFAQPEVSQIQINPGHVTITHRQAPTAQELEQTLKHRQVQFNWQQYYSQGWTFTKHNCCGILQIMFMLIFIAIILDVSALLLVRGITVENDTYDTNTTDIPDATKPQLFQFQFSEGHHPHHPIHEDEPNGPEPNGSASEDDEDQSNHRGQIWMTVFRTIHSIFVYQPIAAGLWMTAFAAMRENQYLKWRGMFSAFNCDYYPSFLRLSILLFVLKTAGFYLLVIPGLLFSFFSTFAVPLHGEHRFLTSWKAIKHSYWVVKNHFCSFFWFSISLILFNLLGVIAFGFGLLITIPVSAFAMCYCYDHLIGVNGVPIVVPSSASSAQSPAPTPSHASIQSSGQQPTAIVSGYPITSSYVVTQPVSPTYITSPSTQQPQPQPQPQSQQPQPPINPAYYAYPVLSTPVVASPVTTTQTVIPVAIPATTATPTYVQAQSSVVPLATTTGVPVAQGTTVVNYPPTAYPAQYPVIQRS